MERTLAHECSATQLTTGPRSLGCVEKPAEFPRGWNMRSVLTFILAGGRGARLQPLTRERAKPAVPFGGIYRIIDFTLSNCLHSGLRQIYVLTQYKSLSLERHIAMGWGMFNPAVGEFITPVPPQQRITERWYLGTADAIHQNWYSVERFSLNQPPLDAVLILAGDHVYKMDYREMVSFHRDKAADLTVGVLRVPLAEAAGQLGVLAAGPKLDIKWFDEKPLEPVAAPDDPHTCLASMGIYVFRPEVLRQCLVQDAQDPSSSHDFGRDIINRMVGRWRVVAFPFELGNRNDTPYWRDVGTLDAYWEAHMDLVSVVPQFNLYDRQWPIHTYYQPWPAAKTVHEDPERTGTAVNSLLSPGCIISGGRVVRSVLSPGVHVHSQALVEDSVLLDRVDIGRGAKVRKAIVDKGTVVGENVEIGYSAAADARLFTVSPGGVVAVAKEEKVTPCQS